MHLVVSTWLLVSAVAIGPGPSATSISRVEAESAATAAGPDVIVGTLY